MFKVFSLCLLIGALGLAGCQTTGGNLDFKKHPQFSIFKKHPQYSKFTTTYGDVDTLAKCFLYTGFYINSGGSLARHSNLMEHHKKFIYFSSTIATMNMMATGKRVSGSFIHDLTKNALSELEEKGANLNSRPKVRGFHEKAKALHDPRGQYSLADKYFIELCEIAVNRNSSLWEQAVDNLYLVPEWTRIFEGFVEGKVRLNLPK